MEEEKDGDMSKPPDSENEVPLDLIPLHSTNLLSVLDEDGIIQYESPSIERIFGFDQDELIGEHVTDYFHQDEREKVIETYQTVVESEEYTVESVEYRHEKADGSYLWVESVASANPTPNGHYVINTRDISDRKAREQELERTNERLDAFASVISHDLRNPLNVAAGQLKLAKEDCDTERLDAVENAHERMQRMIDGLLTVTRVGEEATELQPIELSSFADRCWQNVETADADLQTETDMVVRAHRERLERLLENVFRNAIEHVGDDVTVGVGELKGRNGFYVEDDGSGIPEDEREEVFESGYSTLDTGTGLGLAIVSEIASAHDWDVQVVEGETGGARVEVTGVEIVE